MTIRYVYIITLLSFLTFSSCHKDSESSISEETSIFTPLVLKEVTGSIAGFIYDEQNNPVADALVSYYGGSTATNALGLFIFDNVKLDQQGTYLKISKNGFFHASDLVYPIENATTYSYTKILRLDNSVTFDSKVGTKINVLGGPIITFGADVISDEKGIVYTGEVKVYSKYLSPNDRDLADVMPGGLIADASDGNTVSLGTLGMIAVELRSSSGNKLNISKGKKVIIEFPVVTAFRPSEIPLWSFDEGKGRWKEDGKAFLTGNKYVGVVSHFSFWNIDAKFPIVDICGKVVYEDGSPASNLTVKVEADGLGAAFGVTNNSGEFCGKMPKGKKLNIKIYHAACKTDITEVTLGPFETKTELDKITVKSVKPFIVQGQVVCNTNAIPSGLVVIKVKDSRIVVKTDAEGRFNTDLSVFLCGESLPVTIFAFDTKTSETSPSSILTAGSTQNIVLDVCKVVCDLKAELIYDCKSSIAANISGGSGNYSFKWENGATTKTLTINNQDSTLAAKTYCVTVKDLSTNCEKVFCIQVGGKLTVGMESNCESKVLLAYVSGGSGSISYKWSDGSTTREFKATAVGTYCVTVTDNNGCTATNCNDISDLINISGSPSACNKNIYSFTSSVFDNGRILNSNSGTNVLLTYPVGLDVFKVGFNVAIVLNNKSCSTTKQIKLPQLLQGLTTTVVNTSCGTCLDGKITINVNSGAQCVDCKIGAVKIFKIDDIINDITTTNNDGKMANGEYYVVVTDADTGCYIAYNRVKIN